MILSFKPQFVKPIKAGTKIHTIRKDPHGRWKPGRKIHLATGVRTKHYEQFRSGVCVSTQEIYIKWCSRHGHWMGDTLTFVDGTAVKSDIIEQIAINDGFESVQDFFAWFSEDFSGKIIHFTDLRY